jgi:pimeloyl-ACP methyl ester carboxylesterase
MRADLLEPHLVEIEPGRRLNLRCAGAGSPTVVFEQGGEGMIFNWDRVQPAVEAMTRTCVYDRGGFGWSDPPRYPVTAISVTEDLHALVSRGGIPGPIILVGHSIGGFYATMYADRFFDEVAGLVLVDPGFSGQQSGMRGARRDVEQANLRSGEGGLLRCAELARAGRLTAGTLRTEGCYPAPSPDRGDAARRYALHAVTRPHWYLAEHSQSVSYISSDEKLSVSQQQELDARRSFETLPMRVLSAERFASDPWRTDEENRTAQTIWLAGHADLAKRSSRGRHEVIGQTGHFIQRDRPEAVIQAIADVIAQARSD